MFKKISTIFGLAILILIYAVIITGQYTDIEIPYSGYSPPIAYADTTTGTDLLPQSYTSAIGTPTTVRDTVSAMDSVVFSTSTDLVQNHFGTDFQKVTSWVELHNYSDADTVTYGYVLADSNSYAWLFPGQKQTLRPVYLTKMYFKSFQAGTTFVSTQYTLPTVRQ